MRVFRKKILMKKVKQESLREQISQGCRVKTPDGPGITVGMNMRKNTNGGPGCLQYVVQLDDGRIRHYARNDVVLMTLDAAG